MDQGIKTSIVPIEKIPENPNRRNGTLANTKNYSKHIYEDLKMAYTNHIETFEFVGDYNYTSLITCAKAPIKQLTEELILPGLADEMIGICKELMDIDLTGTPILHKLTHVDGFNSFISLVGMTLDDRRHVYGKINFDYRKELKQQIIRKIKWELALTPIERHRGFRRYVGNK